MATDAPRPTPEHWRLTRMMDQHAFLEIHDGDDLRVGDMLGFDIVHPCLAFDKWRVMAVVDEQYRVLEMIETWF
jgi:D-serine dehydratase